MPGRAVNGDGPPGAGRPWLVKATGGHAMAGGPEAAGLEQSYPLDRDVTTVGGSAGQDIVLSGLKPQHGVIKRERDSDEYVYRQVAADCVSQVNGAIVERADLHHGDRLSLGEWTLVYQREELADHGRYDGGRQGDARVRENDSGAVVSMPSRPGVSRPALVGPRPVLASPRARQHELLRVAWGAACLVAPARIAATLSAAPVDRRTVVVTRVLGARHVLQGVVSGLEPSPGLLLWGGLADLAPTASALALGALSTTRRRLAFIDSVIAAGWGVSSLRDRRRVRQP